MKQTRDISFSFLHSSGDHDGWPSIVLWIDGREYRLTTKEEVDRFEEEFKRQKGYIYDKLPDM